IFLSRGVPEKELRLNLALAFTLIPAIIWAAHHGLNTVTFTVAVLLWIFVNIGQWMAFRIAAISWWQVTRHMLPAVVGALLFTVADLVGLYVWGGSLTDMAVLLLVVPVSIIIYAAFLIIYDRQVLTRLKGFLKGA
ncbi:MAG: hypothetical protein D6677_12065, partial [Calditrichaeota bacterium]